MGAVTATLHAVPQVQQARLQASSPAGNAVPTVSVNRQTAHLFVVCFEHRLKHLLCEATSSNAT
jgi:hypothetical protein